MDDGVKTWGLGAWGIVRTTITSRHVIFLTADRELPTSDTS